MATEMRKTGIDVVGDVSAWGAHFCLFYETKEDLLDTLVSYCKSGLESEEYCLWIVAEPLRIEDATGALKDAVPALDRYVADSRLEIAIKRRHRDRKSTRLNSSHTVISYAVFCLKKKTHTRQRVVTTG